MCVCLCSPQPHGRRVANGKLFLCLHSSNASKDLLVSSPDLWFCLPSQLSPRRCDFLSPDTADQSEARELLLLLSHDQRVAYTISLMPRSLLSFQFGCRPFSKTSQRPGPMKIAYECIFIVSFFGKWAKNAPVVEEDLLIPRCSSISYITCGLRIRSLICIATEMNKHLCPGVVQLTWFLISTA